ncbi:hypothetical protein ACFWY9_14435 [Amycolatopsis sp. NPDC059027]|uniref:hypothetical protein n=1 Tax=unclassified Amycolatopsis TaxID=2618356 RepID=UPI00366A8C3C
MNTAVRVARVCNRGRLATAIAVPSSGRHPIKRIAINPRRTSPPRSCRVRDLTGDPAEVAKLNQIDTNNAALRTAWESVLCLKDYVTARKSGDWNGGLDQYLTNPPSGYRAIGKKKWGRSETRATMNAYGEDRVFPVPEDVDPSGRIAMTSHFKLARIGMRSPRMYVYDGHPSTPCVYIGYIGVHLTNTQTN